MFVVAPVLWSLVQIGIMIRYFATPKDNWSLWPHSRNWALMLCGVALECWVCWNYTLVYLFSLGRNGQSCTHNRSLKPVNKRLKQMWRKYQGAKNFTLVACPLHMGNCTGATQGCPTTLYGSHMWVVKELHMRCTVTTWELPHMSCRGITMYVHCPLQLQYQKKKRPKKPSINQIGSSDEPPIIALIGWCIDWLVIVSVRGWAVDRVKYAELICWWSLAWNAFTFYTCWTVFPIKMWCILWYNAG